MIPTVTQYKKWSLPAKYSFWSIALAIIPIGLSVRDWIIAVPDYSTLAFNYGTSEMSIYGAAGEEPGAAVIIRGANSHEAGVKAEYYWIHRRYPGYKPIFQAVLEKPEPGSSRPTTKLYDANSGAEIEVIQPANLPPRRYDVIRVRNWYGRTREIYFDISTFWGKKSEPRPSGLSEEEALRLNMERLKDAIEQKKHSKKD